MTEDRRPLWKKLAWFVGLAAAGTTATMLAAYALRTLLFSA